MIIARSKKAAFTLIELMVVVGIIALLIGISVPAFRKVRTQAKAVDSKQLLTNLEAGLESFRSERALGNRLPPSRSDANGSGVAPGMIVDPFDGAAVPSTGASLLVLALAGPDKQGTAGFRAVGTANTWADSIGVLYNSGSATRYGPYVGDSAMKRISSIREVRSKGFHAPPIPSSDSDDHFGEQLVFTDLFKSPILYYKARKAARRMITDYSVNPAGVGIYDHNDNWVLTSFEESQYAFDSRHSIRFPGVVNLPLTVPPIANSNTFTSFIIDRDASGCVEAANITCPRAIPHRAKDYLLISAGNDGLWGTPDDITNWK